MKKLLLALMLLFAVPVLATEYDVIAAGGGDYTTIQGCATAAVAGDTCWIFNGTYDERPTPANSGTNGSPISFIKEPGQSPVVRNFNIGYRDWIVIDGLAFTHSGMTDDSLESITVSTSEYNTIQNCSFTDTTAGGIRGNQFSGRAKTIYLHVKDNTFNGIGDANTGSPDYTGGRSIGIACWCDNALIEGNDIQHTADFTNIFGEYNVLRNNTFHDSLESETSGYDGTPASGTHIDGFQSYCTGTNPAAQAADYLLIENNYMYDVPDYNVHFGLINIGADSCGGLTNIIIRYNNTYNIGSSFYLTDGTAASSQQKYKMYNNTLVSSAVVGTSAFTLAKSENSSALNNLMYDAQSGSPYIGFGIGTNTDHDYNLAFQTGGTRTWVSPISDEANAVLNDNPDFTNPASDWTLQAASPAINTGGHLTEVAAGDSGSGTSLIVDDASFFQDGWAGIDPDQIAVGTVGNTAQISSINYGTDTITLSVGITRSEDDEVWLYKDSSGTVVLLGTAPEMGAFEYTPAAPAVGAASSLRIRGQ